ncbi:PEGA domain-containing protein [Candidatus Margulisiibacteriota bacterium]
MKKYIIFFLVVFVFVFASAVDADSGTLRIFSEVEGAAVYVDGEMKGAAPLTISDISEGDHYIIARKNDEKIFSKSVQVSAGETTTVIITAEEEKQIEAPAPVVEKAKEEKKAEAKKKPKEKEKDLGAAIKGFSIDVDATNSAYTNDGTSRTLDPAARFGLGASFRFDDPLASLMNSPMKWILEIGYRTSITETGYTVAATEFKMKASTLYLNDIMPINETFFWGFGLNYTSMIFTWGTATDIGTAQLGYQLLVGMVMDNYLVRLEYMTQNSNASTTTDKDATAGLVLTGSYKLF